MLKEGTVIYTRPERLESPDEWLVCGQVYLGRFVYWSEQDTHMNKYDSPRGFLLDVIAFVESHGITEVDLLMPSSARRARIADLTNAPVYFERGEGQYFLDVYGWRTIKPYDKPDYRDTKTVPYKVYL